jgi:hypothetical protein
MTLIAVRAPRGEPVLILGGSSSVVLSIVRWTSSSRARLGARRDTTSAR